MSERLTAAVLGTGARDPAPSEDPAHCWLSAGGAWRLLLEAGIDELRTRAGRVPPAGTPHPAAPDEHRRLCDPTLTAVLAEQLLHRDRDLVGLILDRLARRGRRVPPSLLPALLGDARARQLPDTWIAGGERARWLAAHRPGWAQPGAVVADGEALEEGTPRQRLDALRQLWASDPNGAVAWLEQAFPGERAATRQAWLDQVPLPPPPVATPWLSGLLQDRSRKVRERASLLLRERPESAVAQACVPGGAACLAWVDGAWEVRLPETWDPGWGGPPPGGPEGERARYATALIATVPLGAWTAASARDPGESVAALDSEDAFVAVAWRHAALRQDDTAWLTALLDRALKTSEASASYRSLVDALPSEILALRAPETLRVRGWGQILPMLEALDRPWPLPVARAWVARFYELAQQVHQGGTEPPADALQSVRPAALGLPPVLFALDTRSWVDRLAPTRAQALVAQALDDLEHVLRVRRHLDDLLLDSPGAPRD